MIRFGGREMPQGISFSENTRERKADGNRFTVPEIAIDPRHREFEANLRETLRRESGIEAFRNAKVIDRDDLVQAYDLAFGSLRRLSADWHGFIQTLIRIDFTGDGQHSGKAKEFLREHEERWQKEVLSDPGLQAPVFSSALTAAVISQEIPVAFRTLVKDIESKIEELHSAILAQLIRLIELEVCGVLERYPNHVYAYHYFFRKLNATELGRHKYSTFGFEFWEELGRETRVTRISEVVEADITLTLCRRVHHIINGIEISPERASIPTPRYHQSVLDAVPAWLRPMTILVEGTLVGEAGLDHDIKHFSDSREEVLEVKYHRDPALVLGQIVLTGWGPSELEADATQDGHEAEAPEARGKGVSASWKSVSLLPAKLLAAGASWGDRVRDRDE